jgi:hypothetical protein
MPISLISHQVAATRDPRGSGSVAANLGNLLKSAANDVIDLAPLFRTFEVMNVQDSPAPAQQQQGRRRPRFRPPAPRDL